MINIRISKTSQSPGWYAVHFPATAHELLPKQLAYKVYPTHIELKTPSTIDTEKVANLVKDGGNIYQKGKKLFLKSHYQDIEVGHYTLEKEDSDTFTINL